MVPRTAEPLCWVLGLMGERGERAGFVRYRKGGIELLRMDDKQLMYKMFVGTEQPAWLGYVII